MDNSNITNTPLQTNVPPPVGLNFSIEMMRQIATRNNAVSFIDQQPTNGSDSGCMINRDDSAMQFGVATYVLQSGIQITHSVASFLPSEMRDYAQQGGSAPIYFYNDVIDIALPYYVPHMIVFSRLNEGFVQPLLATSAPFYSPSVASRIRLEGDFSEFVDTYTPPNEDIAAFVYLVPNVMELLLKRASRFTVEFVDNHIYLYFRQEKAAQIALGYNTNITVESYEHTLRTGFEIADSLARAGRPLQQATQSTTRIPRPSAMAALGSALKPLFIGFIAGFIIIVMSGMLSSIISPIFIFGLLFLNVSIVFTIFARRLRQNSRRVKRYKERYQEKKIS
jgi:ABC-type multidrug transport system fused ATPase/permease subunit